VLDDFVRIDVAYSWYNWTTYCTDLHSGESAKGGLTGGALFFDRVRAKNVRAWRRPALDPALSFETILPGPSGGAGAWVVAALLMRPSEVVGADFRFGNCDTWMSPLSPSTTPVHGPGATCSGVCSSVVTK